MENFNVGIDCEDIDRWHNMLSKLESGAQHKLFTEAEHLYCKSFKNPEAHYAARWCAKEALLKALYPFCKVDLRQIEIANDKEGKPFFVISDPQVAKLNLAIRVSLSHSKKTAMAIVVVAVGPDAQNSII
ncbi:MAG: holo-ACP synthase [Chlorobiaceae bacterium]|nr:holo-ACP synthase [Chlorobiaceae bacterium]